VSRSYLPSTAWLAAKFLLVLASMVTLGCESCGTQDHILLTARLLQSLIGRSVKLLLVFARKVIPGFGLLEINDQDFCSFLDMYVFRNGASSKARNSSK
jgi:hypothetical protein